MAGRFCQECGAANEAIARYCAKCGSELRAGVPPASPPAPAPYAPYPQPVAPPGPAVPPLYSPYTYPPVYGPAYPYAGPYIGYPNYAGPYIGYPNYAEMERVKQVDRTKTGLLLLAVGFLIGWVPVIGAVGSLLSLIGAILVILGRKAFGDRHSNFVVVSVILYIAALVLTGVFVAWFFVVTFQAFSQGSPRPFLSAFWPFLGGVIAASALGAVAEVLFVHELEKPIGRYLLYAALVASIAVPLATVLILLPAFTAVLDGIANGTIGNPGDPRLEVLQTIGSTLALLSVLPSVLFGVAYFLAWQRIDRREIPAPPAVAAPVAPAPFAIAPPVAPPPVPPPATATSPPGPVPPPAPPESGGPPP